ncbi:unnamed protein product, partial [Effrenium voratum]
MIAQAFQPVAHIFQYQKRAGYLFQDVSNSPTGPLVLRGIPEAKRRSLQTVHATARLERMAVHDVLVEVASVKLSPGTYGSDGARHPSFAFGIARTAVRHASEKYSFCSAMIGFVSGCRRPTSMQHQLFAENGPLSTQASVPG